MRFNLRLGTTPDRGLHLNEVVSRFWSIIGHQQSLPHLICTKCSCMEHERRWGASSATPVYSAPAGCRGTAQQVILAIANMVARIA